MKPECLKYIDGSLHFGEVDLSTIDTPSYVFCSDQLETEYKKLKNSFSSVFSDFSIYYSTKTNDRDFVISKLDSLDSFFTVSSEYEADFLVSQMKVDGSRLMANQALYTSSDIKKYVELGIPLFVVGDEKYLIELDKFSSSQDIEYLMIIDLMAKKHEIAFDYKKIVDIANRYPNLKFKGLAFYIQTQNTNVFLWQSYVNKVLDIISVIEMDFPVEIVNIGSGFPVEYNKSGIDTYTVIDRISNTLSKLDRFKVIIEPGRAIVASSVALISSVLFLKNEDVWIDGSIYNAFLDAKLTKVKLPCLNVCEQTEFDNYNVFGRSNCAADIFFKDREVGKISVGDRLCFYNAGAYLFSTDFIHFPKVKFYGQR